MKMTNDLKDLTPELKINSEEKTIDKKEKTVKNVKDDESNYTTSPDGKYKFRIATEFDSDRLEENQFNIPQIKIPGWVVIWPHDIKANTIAQMMAKGWIFVSKEENPAAGRKIVAGRTQGGETAFHYAMKMPEAKFKELQAREEEQRQNLVASIKKAPSKESKAIYATDQMK